MTDIEQKALALLNAVEKKMGLFKTKALSPDNPAEVALCRAIEQHEAFRQEVSDAAEVYEEMGCPMAWEGFEQFIIAKPDPLAEALLSAWPQYADRKDACSNDANALRAALEARGLEIREKRR